MKSSCLAVPGALLFLACTTPEGGAPRLRPADTVLSELVAAPDAETAARRVLDAPADLRLVSVRESLVGEHVRFVQLADDGTPVLGGEVSVHFAGRAPDYTLRMIRSSAIRPLRLTAQRALGKQAAEERATHEVARLHPALGSRVLSSFAMVRPHADDTGRPGWRVVVSTAEPFHEWEVWVNGDTGSTAILRDMLLHVDGAGYVYRPNPITQTADETMDDNNDGDTAALTDARRWVTLQGLDGSGNLRGDYADAHVKNGQRANEASLQFDYTRSDPRFGEVVTYYHVDHANRNLQALGFTDAKAIADFAIEMIVDGTNQDNSWYSPGDNNITLGKGGVDDAEDGDIIIHEYGHAVAHDIVPDFGASSEAGAMGEGFSDILAASTPTNDADAVSRACVAPWDALSYGDPNPVFPCLRRVDGQKHYPEHLFGWVHEDGEIWSGAIWEMYSTTGLGPSAGLRLVAESLFSLSASASFRDSADAIVVADEDLNGGANVDAIKRAFIWHGLFDTITPESIFPAPTTAHAIDVQSPHPIGDMADGMETISHPGATAIRAHFASMEMETGGSCPDSQCDNVYIYDAAGRLYAKLSGTQDDFFSPAVPGDSMIVRWVSDDGGSSQGITIDSYEISVTDLPDAAPTPDAPIIPDAAPTPDSAPTPDGPPPPPDAALPADAAPGTDGWPEQDAGTDDDGGVIFVDAGATADAAPTVDSPTAAADAATGGDPGGGCGCRSTGTGSDPHASALLFALVALALRRRRRQRS